jgi:hypothetical protein
MTPHSSPSRSLRSLRLAPWALAPLALALALAPYDAPPHAAAQAPSPLNGTWQLSGDPTQAAAMIQQTIEPALAVMTPDLQRVARARLAETTWVPSTITVTTAPNRIAVGFAGAENRTFDTAPGQPQSVFSRSGVRAQMTQTFRPDGGIEQQFVALDGTQWHMLVPDANGQVMYLEVLLRSPRLGQDIRFRLVYQRR